jgi:hypothetical protein
VHWGLADPAAIDDVDGARMAFASCFNTLATRVDSVMQQTSEMHDKAAIVAAMRQFKSELSVASRRVSR